MFALKKRYFLTRQNSVRLRYLTGAAALVIAAASMGLQGSHYDLRLPTVSMPMPRLAMPALPQLDDMKFSFASLAWARDALSFHDAVESSSDLSIAEDTPEAEPGLYQKASFVPRLFGGFDGQDVDDAVPHLDMQAALKALKKPDGPHRQELTLESGGTLSETMQEAGVSLRDAILAIRALSDYFDPRKVKAGQTFSVETQRDENGDMILAKMVLPMSAAKSVEISRAEDGHYESGLQEKEVFTRHYASSVQIDSSLYASAARVGVPAQVIAELIRIYSWDVDFQRDIRSGDALKVMYGVKETEDGDFAGYGDVLFASLSVGGEAHPIYRYETKDGDIDYFDPNGRSIRKTLMKTPVDGARLSSGFGMRHHPVLGYNKMHKGVDFAAPTGTPIYAAGDGTIEYAGRKGSYGNYIRLRHNGTLKTAYAHLHKFAKSISTGTRVKQGQVIGYIGTTGRSTGPHLHYEVLLNDTQVSPNRVDLPVGESLKDQELERFKALISVADQEYASLSGDSTRVAQSDAGAVEVLSNEIR